MEVSNIGVRIQLRAEYSSYTYCIVITGSIFEWISPYWPNESVALLKRQISLCYNH